MLAIERALGSTEHLFWLSDQVKPMHFSVCARIPCTRSQDVWASAFEAIERRYPRLGAEIVADRQGRPYFTSSPSSGHTLRILTAPEASWQTVMQSELSEPFPSSGARLVRAVLICEPSAATLVLSAHHSAADGISLVLVIRDLLRVLSGEHLEPAPPMSSQDVLIGRVTTDPKIAAEPLAPPVGGRTALSRPHLDMRCFPEEFTGHLCARARQEGTTVHGSLMAALVLAGRRNAPSWAEEPVRVVSPINGRKALGLDDAFGLLLGGATVTFATGSRAGFWETARTAKYGVKPAETLEHLRHSVDAARGFMTADPDAAAANQFVLGGFHGHIVLTNLGRLVEPLEAFWGPAVLTGVENQQTIGAATVNGRLHLLHTSRSPVVGLLHETAEVLCSALSSS